jgi:hypothetical protein
VLSCILRSELRSFMSAMATTIITATTPQITTIQSSIIQIHFTCYGFLFAAVTSTFTRFPVISIL